MLIFTSQRSHLDIPLRDWTRACLGKASQASNRFKDKDKLTKLLEDFNSKSLSEQIGYIGASRTKEASELLGFNKSIKPNNLGRCGGSESHERSCEISSSSYTTFNWNYFITDAKGIYLKAELNNEHGFFCMTPHIASRGSIYVRNHGMIAPMQPIGGHYNLEKGNVPLGGSFEGYIDLGRENVKYELNSTYLHTNLYKGYSKQRQLLRAELKKSIKK
jgi:hypothetical protein